MKKNGMNKIFGLLLLVTGIGFLGNAFNVWDFSIFFAGWWTLFLILPSLGSMISSGIHIWNSIPLTFGLYFLLKAQGFIQFEITFLMIAAFFLIFIGFQLIFPSKKKKKWNIDEELGRETTGPKYTYSNVFGIRKMKVTQPFDTATIESIFGQLEIDCSSLNLSEVKKISIEAVFGEVVLIVNEDVFCEIYGDNVFGTIRYNHNPNSSYPVIVKASAVFGVITIRTLKGSKQAQAEEEVIIVTMEV